MQQPDIKGRVLSLFIYALFLVAVQRWVISTGLTPNQNAIWLYNGLASLLFGSRLLYPYFTPPADAATNAFAALFSLVAAFPSVVRNTSDYWLLVAICAICTLVLLAACLVLVARPPMGEPQPLWVQAFDRAVRVLGSPNIIFTVVILTAVWLFHRERPAEVFAILASYTVITLVRPIEGVVTFANWIKGQSELEQADRVGQVAAYQTPNIALIRQVTEETIARGTTLLVSGDHGKWLLGIALNYVGRDEGNLLRTLTTTLPAQLATIAGATKRTSQTGGIALTLAIPEEQRPLVTALEWINRLCGIVDSETTFEMLRFEVIDETGLSEGRLVEARIGEHRNVLFQVIEGITHEDVVQQKNKYGYVRAKARKIGRWDNANQKFVHVPWLPNINAPVFLREEAAFVFNPNNVGHFPKTNYGVSLDTNSAVTHNTAILGILGIGKSYLAAELVERMIRAGTRVICFDLTNQYADLLAPYIDGAADIAADNALTQAGAGGQPNQNRELGGSRRAFRQKVKDQFTNFFDPQNNRQLRVINPSLFAVTKQASGMFQGNAELTTLTPCEITAIMSDVALEVVQALGVTENARACLVYEEAHSLIPEWSSVASDGDKAATAQTARAILQGRKFGLGALVVTQRTANVTKTILNQCNTIIAMRTFDDTGKEFLSNYLGADYASVLPSLEHRHAVIFGKASSCENPVLIKLNDRQAFLGGYRQPNNDGPPPNPGPDEIVQENPG